MHNIENAEPLSPFKRSMADLRGAVGQSWPEGKDASWESEFARTQNELLMGSNLAAYSVTAAPKGAQSYTAKNLGLT